MLIAQPKRNELCGIATYLYSGERSGRGSSVSPSGGSEGLSGGRDGFLGSPQAGVWLV